jgi:hypothetical protein
MNTPAMPFDGWGGFTKLEAACVQLKVTHPDAPEWLNELVRRSREMDFAGQAVVGISLRHWEDKVTHKVPDNVFDLWAGAAHATAKAMMEEL